MKQKLILCVASMMLLMSPIFAQPNQGSAQRPRVDKQEMAKKRADWKKKVKAEKTAFLKKQLELTAKEDKAFWPVYNQLEKDRDLLTTKKIKAYRALSQALKDLKSEKEVEKLLEDYLDAQSELRDIEETYTKKLKKILGSQKLAKLYVSEERFRHMQIQRLGKHNFQKPQQRQRIHQ